MPDEVARDIIVIEPVDLRGNVRFAVDPAVPELHDSRVNVLWDLVAAYSDGSHGKRRERTGDRFDLGLGS